MALKDREPLYWLCLKGIPPERGDNWAPEDTSKIKETTTINIRLNIGQCIKLTLRPASITNKPDALVSAVTWSRTGDKLIANNPTPFYMDLVRKRL